ncbi:S-norcoclaurine synthase 1-like isoform X1 [Syzygium oleosum]|uniref:S-norcoclaurine synthase 1-like isoform X1 n=1 Tax=Syzygium oleosum TaxID=219896 RepID=UPI0024B8C379|nr:S-norcoclaurine synthase 1-like isoform X1 [Syzygium oleosum]
MEIEVLHRSDLGGSLPVKNVQALASKGLKEVPSRYLRPASELGEVCDTESLEIPVIDMIKLGEDHPDHSDEIEKFHWACKEWGFLQLINHGISEEFIHQVKTNTEEFFKLPLEEKKNYEQLPNSIEGYGQAFVVSEDQKLDWSDMLLLFVQPASQRNLRFWPKNPASFRATLDSYSSELVRISLFLLRAMAKNLGLSPDVLASMFEDGIQGIRLNYYPPCKQANEVLGHTPHSDATGLTLLTQVNDVDGLQIKKNGKWLPIKPVHRAFIVNVGDIIEIMSNGQYKSIEHRVVVNPEKERLSIAAFHSPNIEAMIGPFPDLAGKSGALYKTTSHEDYMRLVVASRLDEERQEDCNKNQESHSMSAHTSISVETPQCYNSGIDRWMKSSRDLPKNLLLTPITPNSRLSIRESHHTHFAPLHDLNNTSQKQRQRKQKSTLFREQLQRAHGNG